MFTPQADCAFHLLLEQPKAAAANQLRLVYARARRLPQHNAHIRLLQLLLLVLLKENHQPLKPDANTSHTATHSRPCCQPAQGNDAHDDCRCCDCAKHTPAAAAPAAAATATAATAAAA